MTPTTIGILIGLVLFLVTLWAVWRLIRVADDDEDASWERYQAERERLERKAFDAAAEDYRKATEGHGERPGS